MSLPMLDVHDLLGHPGAARTIDLLGTIDGLATELVAVPDDAMLGGPLSLESVIEGVFVAGTVTGTWRLRYEDFETVSGTDLPRTILFAEGGGSFDEGAEIKLKDRRLNEPISEASFRLEAPPGVRTVPVGCGPPPR